LACWLLCVPFHFIPRSVPFYFVLFPFLFHFVSPLIPLLHMLIRSFLFLSSTETNTPPNTPHPYARARAKSGETPGVDAHGY
jgi:hypothetical protein